MSNNNTATATARSGGVGIFGLAFIALLVFKLAYLGGASWGVNIPWLVVFLPVVVGFGLTILILLIFLAIVIFADK